MTRLYYSMGRLRLRVFLLFFSSLIFFGSLETWAFLLELNLPSDQLPRVLQLTALAMALTFIPVISLALLRLRPIVDLLQQLHQHGMTTPRQEQAARETALGYPLRSIALTFLAYFFSLLVLLLINTFWLRLSFASQISFFLGSLSILLVAATFLYVMLRSILRPVVAHFRHEEVPPGTRLSIRTKLLLAVLTISISATIPLAIIAAHHTQRVQRSEINENHRHLAQAIAYGGLIMDPETLRQSTAAARLSPGMHIRFSPFLSSTSAALPPDSTARYVQVSGSEPSAQDIRPLLITVVLLIGLATYMGSFLGRTLTRDITLVNDRLRTLARPLETVQPVPPLSNKEPQFSDLRHLADAVNRLLLRITEFHVAQYVAIEKALAADRMKMQFLANVSHDLRSPLNSILGFAELLLQDVEQRLDHDQQQALELIHRSGTILLRTIDEVLDVAKLEVGRISLHREYVLPIHIINDAIRELQRDGIPPHVTLEIDLQAGLPMIWVDPHRLSQALEHIVRFLLLSLEKGKIVFRLKLASQRDASDAAQPVLQLCIADTGPGLQTEEVARLFSGFRRQPGQRGLGLALPLAKAFISMHRGTLHVYSTPGVGTTFIAEIPLLRHRKLAVRLPDKV